MTSYFLRGSQTQRPFFTSKKFERSLFAESMSSCDATATATPLSLTESIASANSLKSFKLKKDKMEVTFLISLTITMLKNRNWLFHKSPQDIPRHIVMSKVQKMYKFIYIR